MNTELLTTRIEFPHFSIDVVTERISGAAFISGDGICSRCVELLLQSQRMSVATFGDLASYVGSDSLKSDLTGDIQSASELIAALVGASMVPIDERRTPLLWECGIDVSKLAIRHQESQMYSFCMNGNPETGGDVFRCVLDLDSFQLSVERIFNQMSVFAGTEKASSAYLKA